MSNLAAEAHVYWEDQYKSQEEKQDQEWLETYIQFVSQLKPGDQKLNDLKWMTAKWNEIMRMKRLIDLID